MHAITEITYNPIARDIKMTFSQTKPIISTEGED